MKAFFTWLYGVILKLGEESIPPNMKQHLTAEELKLVIHFLKKRLAMVSTWMCVYTHAFTILMCLNHKSYSSFEGF
jgi:hypothetical protein